MSLPPLSEAAFADEAHAFLSAHARRRQDRKLVWGEGDDSRFKVHKDFDPAEEQDSIAAAKAWRALRYDHGFGWITGPKRYGGRELPVSHELLYREIEAGYDVPDQDCFIVSLGMVAPTIQAIGPDFLREKYLRALCRGDLIGCQLFSEPGAGSDLAAMRTRAVRDGDEWVVSGQKVWTTLAHQADIGELVCRTDPDSTRHHGLSAFVIDMKAPGVTVRPIRQMTGGASFNEVFFDALRVPDDHRLAGVGEGWKVVITTLMNERASIGTAGSALKIDWLVAMARHYGLHRDPALREAIGSLHVHLRTADLMAEEGLARLRRGQEPGPGMSVGKLVGTDNLVEATQVISRMLGPKLVADAKEWGSYAFHDLLLGFPGYRVAGGTDEIMRNTVAERVLGLPREPRP